MNYVLLMANATGQARLAFWGHGANFEPNQANHAGEAIKKSLSRHVHWWFAYNETSGRIVSVMPYPAERITIVNNSIDTKRFMSLASTTTPADLARVRDKYGLRGNNVCVFSGAIYENKRPAFLLESALEIRRVVPDFELLVLGAGPQESVFKAAASRHSWIRCTGPLFDRDLVECFLVSKLVLNPGAVGLVILDAISLATPLITTDVPFHGPEIEYLADGFNGLIVKETEDPSGLCGCGVRSVTRRQPSPGAQKGLSTNEFEVLNRGHDCAFRRRNPRGSRGAQVPVAAHPVARVSADAGLCTAIAPPLRSLPRLMP